MSGPAMMAASARAYNAANVMLMRSESTSADTLVAMLASCGAQGMQGEHIFLTPRSVGGLEDAVMGGQKRPFYPMFDTSEETGDDDVGDDCSHHVEKKRRLTVDQVRSLEKNFELENKLEPERKMQLARELGLQPRQVAVWFQNRRARWKTKQLERDYDVLKLDYDALKSEYDSVVEDKENLQAEIRHLKSKLQSQSKQRKLVDGQVFGGADGLDGAVDLAPHLDMALKSEPAGGVHDQQDGPQQQQSQLQQQQESYPTGPVVTAGVTTTQTQESPVKSKGSGGSTSSESNSSEIMNADSPHPIDSGLSPGVDQKTTTPTTTTTTSSSGSPFTVCNQLPSSTPGQTTGADNTTNNVDASLVQFAEDLCGGGRLVAPQPFQRIAVKLEDGVLSSNTLQEECSNYFYTMDESGTLPWWEWP
ncbi:unnamed protein product [Calypogeia fissa]